MKVDYPVAVDNNHAIWHAFRNQAWPALYFIDAQGRVRHHFFGEDSYEQSEMVIQSLLREPVPPTSAANRLWWMPAVTKPPPIGAISLPLPYQCDLAI